MQQELGVPVIDSVVAPFKYAEFLVESAQRFGWYPSRMWGSEAPPLSEIKQWKLFDKPAPKGGKAKTRLVRLDELLTRLYVHPTSQEQARCIFHY